MKPNTVIYLVGVILTCVQVCFGSSLTFNVAPGYTKCFREELSKNQIVSGEFRMNALSTMTMRFWIEDPQQKTVTNQEDTTGATYAFTADHDGDYAFCFQDLLRNGVYGGYNSNATPRRVTLTMKLDEEAELEKAQAQIKDKLAPLDNKLKEIENTARLAKQEAIHARERESAHRDSSEEINARVVWLSALSIVIVVALSLWQFWAQRSFLKRKKVI